MSDRLPLYINPERAAGRGLEASSDYGLEKMPQLGERLIAPFGKVSVKLKFNKIGKRKFLVGHIVGEMIVECQRCMKGMEIPIDHDFKLGMIESEAEIDWLMPDEEPLLISNEEMFVADIIEDELELLLPMVVMHNDTKCESAYRMTTVDEKSETVEKLDQNEEHKRPNPFSVLGSLKK